MCLLPVVMSHCEDSGEKSFEKKEKPGSNCRLKIAQYSYSWRLWWFKGSSSLKHDTLSHSEEQMLEECQKIRRLGCKGIRQLHFESSCFGSSDFRPTMRAHTRNVDRRPIRCLDRTGVRSRKKRNLTASIPNG